LISARALDASSRGVHAPGDLHRRAAGGLGHRHEHQLYPLGLQLPGHLLADLGERGVNLLVDEHRQLLERDHLAEVEHAAAEVPRLGDVGQVLHPALARLDRHPLGLCVEHRHRYGRPGEHAPPGHHVGREGAEGDDQIRRQGVEQPIRHALDAGVGVVPGERQVRGEGDIELPLGQGQHFLLDPVQGLVHPRGGAVHQHADAHGLAGQGWRRRRRRQGDDSSQDCGSLHHFFSSLA